MEVYFYKLKFKSAVHFGQTGIYLENVQETINSDTLFSALINTVSIYYGNEVDTWIEKFKTNPPFLLSSLFIYNRDKYFLPRPLEDSFISKEVKKEMGKELKKLKLIEAQHFLKWQQRTPFTVDDIREMSELSKTYSCPYEREIVPRVTLDRNTQQSSIYFCGVIKFNDNAGLWGFIAFRDNSFVEKFKTLLRLLGETGIGGEKTYGYGMFDLIEFKPVQGILKDIVQSNSTYYTLLSLYHPSEGDNVKEKLIAYNLIRKKGWITSGRHALPLKRKSLGFLTEGSVLKEPVIGMLVDVTPDFAPAESLNHKVYRYGYALIAPLKEN